MDLRERVLDAADYLLARYGYKKMTMDDLAEQARVGRRTIYLHFPGKEEVALATIDRRMGRLVAHLETLAASAPSSCEGLRALLIGRVLFLFDAAQALSQTYDEMMVALRPVYMPRREHYLRAEARVVADVLAAGVQTGEFAVDDPDETALSLLLATNALMPFSLSREQRADRASVAQRVTQIADLLLNGVLQRSGERG
jgi:AcrR family transcriptional regulator